METLDKGKQPICNDIPLEMAWTPEFAMAEDSPQFLDVTEGLQRLYLGDDNSTPPQSTPASATPVPSTPVSPIPITSGSSYCTLHRAPPVPPRLGTRKTRTAPRGSLNLVTQPPELPRRAHSARRVQRRRANKENDSRDISPGSPILPRFSVTPAQTSRSIISRRKSMRLAGGRIGPKPRISVVRVITAKHVRGISDSSMNETRTGWWDPPEGSFPGQRRLHEKLKGKREEMLDTRIVDFADRALPDTPGSIVMTPRELYRSRTPDKLSLRPAQQRRALQPTTPNKGRAKLSPSRPSPRVHSSRERRGSSRWSLRTGSTLAIISPEESPWQQHIYIPGPIPLKNAASAVERKASIASLDPFWSAVEKEEAHRASDDAVIDAIVEYFEGFHILDRSDKAGMDRYWERGTEPPKRALPRRPAPPPALMPSALSVLVPSPYSSPRTPRLLSGGSLPKSGGGKAVTPQRIKLRRLLGSASSIL